MLEKTLLMPVNAGMGRKTKRTRVLADKNAPTQITIRAHVDSKGYTSHLVQGWKEDGKWQRKQFRDLAKAEQFVALKRVEVENQGRKQRLMLCPLSDEQLDQAVKAFDRLGATYTLAEALDFFLRNHRPPEFTIRLRDAINLYLDDRERDGIRDRSRLAIKSVVEQFLRTADNPWTHEVTANDIESFLRGLRAKDGKNKATRKTWNNYRNALHSLFDWCALSDVASNRPFVFQNPVANVRKFAARQVREEQNTKPATTSPENVLRLFRVLSRWRGGVMVRYYALLYFAGLRPGEIERMNGDEAKLINLKTRIITIPAKVSKTRHERQVDISENLAAWLAVSAPPAVPTNFDRMAKMIRRHFELDHDEARHSFISYHVALFRSVGDVALQAGNSESIVRRHYLNLHPRGEGDAFFRIVPSGDRSRANFSAIPAADPAALLRAVG
jgi:integrase